MMGPAVAAGFLGKAQLDVKESGIRCCSHAVMHA